MFAAFQDNASDSLSTLLIATTCALLHPRTCLGTCCLTSPGIVGKRCCLVQRAAGCMLALFLSTCCNAYSWPSPKKGFTVPIVQLQACGQLHAHPEGADTPAAPALALQAALNIADHMAARYNAGELPQPPPGTASWSKDQRLWQGVGADHACGASRIAAGACICVMHSQEPVTAVLASCIPAAGIWLHVPGGLESMPLPHPKLRQRGSSTDRATSGKARPLGRDSADIERGSQQETIRMPRTSGSEWSLLNLLGCMPVTHMAMK